MEIPKIKPIQPNKKEINNDKQKRKKIGFQINKISLIALEIILPIRENPFLMATPALFLFPPKLFFLMNYQNQKFYQKRYRLPLL